MLGKMVSLPCLGIFSILLVLVTSQFTPEDLIVDAGDLGQIKGRNTSTTAELNGERKPYLQFLGIPYANVTQRFMPSTLKEGPLTSNGEIFSALFAGPQCYQPSPFPILMDEYNCLSINIYTPKKFTGNESELLPTIFFIHGGAFTVGSGSQFSAIRILNREVVYVTFNYRLGIAGFFSLQDDISPGNGAMYDIVNALKWTNKYIKFFGGNPDLVTIAGQSAGSVAVTQMLASPMARGLFHRAIAASGSALNAWGTISDPMRDSIRIAEMSGCPNLTNLTLIAQCMRSVPAEKLVDILFQYQVTERNQGRLGFAAVSPVVQNWNMTVHQPFMPENPLEIFSRGEQARVPLMMGCTKHDGSYVLGVFYNRFLKDNGLEKNVTFLKTELVPSLLKALDVEDNPAGIYDSLTHTYLGETRTSGNFNDMYPGLIDLFSVFFFKGATYKTALFHSKVVNNTYWYSFEFKGSSSLFASLFGNEVPPFPGGITHMDDLIYTYLLTFLTFTAEEAAVSSRMLDYWANFAKIGNPTPPNTNLTTWLALDEESQNYMSIDKESFGDVFYSHTWVGPGLDVTPAPTTTTTPIPTPIRISSTQSTTTTSGEPGQSSTDLVEPTTPNSAYFPYLSSLLSLSCLSACILLQ